MLFLPVHIPGLCFLDFTTSQGKLICPGNINKHSSRNDDSQTLISNSSQELWTFAPTPWSASSWVYHLPSQLNSFQTEPFYILVPLLPGFWLSPATLLPAQSCILEISQAHWTLLSLHLSHGRRLETQGNLPWEYLSRPTILVWQHPPTFGLSPLLAPVSLLLEFIFC